VILLLLFVLFTGLQCCFAAFFLRQLRFLKKEITAPPAIWQPVSVLICANNEENNLSTNLNSILNQQYDGTFEVIVVNDGSTDGTKDVLRKLQSQNTHLTVVNLSTHSGKKKALMEAVATAKYDLLLMTDADCLPASNHWLQIMTSQLHGSKEIAAGYGGYEATTGLLNAFTRWETMHTFMQYSSYALAGLPYMAVGRNMACTRGAMQKAMADPIWHALPSGDDDLLVRISGTPVNTITVCDPAAFTVSAAKDTWKSWAHQKQRHLSTGKYYRWETKLFLALYGISHAGMWLSLLLLIPVSDYPGLILSLFSARCILTWLAWARTSAMLGEKKLLYRFPLFDLGWMMYNFAFLPYITWKNKQNWK
jgi:cellulose synthase/poly-beta-1,6-N-acetylglucosamine synthase-like glycosyltransferase